MKNNISENKKTIDDFKDLDKQITRSTVNDWIIISKNKIKEILQKISSNN